LWFLHPYFAEGEDFPEKAGGEDGKQTVCHWQVDDHITSRNPRPKERHGGVERGAAKRKKQDFNYVGWGRNIVEKTTELRGRGRKNEGKLKCRESKNTGRLKPRPPWGKGIVFLGETYLGRRRGEEGRPYFTKGTPVGKQTRHRPCIKTFTTCPGGFQRPGRDGTGGGEEER